MAIPKNGVYKLLRFPKVGAIATRTPSFPSVCPTCGKARKPKTMAEERQDDPAIRTAHYECGGLYGPLATNDAEHNFFSGQCGDPLKNGKVTDFKSAIGPVDAARVKAAIESPPSKQS